MQTGHLSIERSLNCNAPKQYTQIFVCFPAGSWSIHKHEGDKACLLEYCSTVRRAWHTMQAAAVSDSSGAVQIGGL